MSPYQALPGIEQLAKRPHEALRQRMKRVGRGFPEGPKGPRLALLRRIVRLIRGGRD